MNNEENKMTKYDGLELDQSKLDNLEIDEKRLNKLKKEYDNMHIPKNTLEGIQGSILKAKKDKKKLKLTKKLKNCGLGLVATLIFCIVLYSSNENIARAMGSMPVIGRIVNVINFGGFEFEDKNHHADVSIPEIKVDDKKELTDGIKSTNDQAKVYTKRLIDKFDKEIGEVGGKQGLDVSYDVVTDIENWFTLRINVLETKASGYQYAKYYNIDKNTGESVELKDLFKENSNYKDIISQDIKEQMRKQMKSSKEKSYFIDDKDIPDGNFETIKDNQNFYIDNDGKLVLVFDEYEVAPGYMGCPEFVIQNKTIEKIRK